MELHHPPTHPVAVIAVGVLSAGKGGKIALGGLLVAVGILVVSGLDKELEAILVQASPLWLTNLTTSF